MNDKVVINLDQFELRDYQLPIFDALVNKGYKKIIAILPRRAGKDLTAFNLLIRMALTKVGIYWHCLPTQAHARKVIWDAISNSGKSFLSYIPPELITSKNASLMSIKLINGSIIQLVGSNNYNSLIGTNPCGIIFSEYSTADPKAYQFLRPVLIANDGWVIFLSTPRGKNHLYDLYKIAQDNPNDWFSYKLTVDDTKHIPKEMIDKEIASGEMSYDLAMQEYWTSWDLGVEGAFYTKILDKMRLNNQITTIMWNPEYKVHTAWDLGWADPTCIIFFQLIGNAIHIIDHYKKSFEPQEHFANLVLSKPYTYGTHIFPHDIKVHETQTGLTRFNSYSQLGIHGEIATKLSFDEGIEKVRASLPRTFIDQVRCAELIKSLENYRQVYDSTNNVYKSGPLHDWSSHDADCARYMFVSLNKLQDGMTEEKANQYRRESLYGDSSNIPEVFKNPTRW